jgi:hypothetical protein
MPPILPKAGVSELLPFFQEDTRFRRLVSTASFTLLKAAAWSADSSGCSDGAYIRRTVRSGSSIEGPTALLEQVGRRRVSWRCLVIGKI